MNNNYFLLPLFILLGCSQATQTAEEGSDINSDSTSTKTYDYEDLEHLNDRVHIIVNTPTYNQFINNDSIKWSCQLRTELLDLDEFWKIDSSNFQFFGDSLRVRKVYYSQGHCLHYVPTFKISKDFISIRTPTPVVVEPEEYFKNNDYEYSECELANVVELNIRLIISSEDVGKKVILNGRTIK